MSNVDNAKTKFGINRILELRRFTTNSNNGFDLTEVEENVYKLLGYEVVERSEPFAKVRLLKRPSCEKVFRDWLNIAHTYDPKHKPLREIPPELYSNFTLFNHSYVTKWYFDDRSEKSTAYWGKERINKLLNSKSIGTTAYSGEGEGMYHAMHHFPLNGTNGIVIGSLSPWLEAYCLKCGAEKVTTLEYKKIKCDHPRVDYLHPIEIANRWEQYYETFGFAASFSSIEHSGLGRFGDALDPIGDIRELQKIRCLLKKGGYVFLGIPSGADGIFFNAHRIYGRIRLPLLFEGFDLVGIFYNRTDEPVHLDNDYFAERNGKQYVYALRKLDD